MNEDRLWLRIMELGEIGAQGEGKGVTRFSFTEEERRAKELVMHYMKEAGLSVREDAVGNLIGRREGEDPSLPVVLTGSHIDTVPHGGRFDGALGVLTAIEALQRMKEQGITTLHPIEVVAFTDEEGSRFGFGMIGSRALAGTLLPEHLLKTDENGLSIGQAMQETGYNPSKIREAARNADHIKAYLELHIEQGKVLESANLSVGVVSGIAGPLWLQFSLSGEAGHAGATPMNMRKDPVPTAAEILLYIRNETIKYPNAVATTGKMQLLPGGVNVIANRVVFTLDLRDIAIDIRNELEDKIRSHAEKVCKLSGIGLEILTLQRVKPAICSEEIMGVIEKASQKAGQPYTKVVSGAGHDGMQFGNVCPIGMIFIRSHKGISHNPLEWSSPEDCKAGAEVFYHAIQELAGH